MSLALLLALLASDRVDIRGGQLPAPGVDRCIRLHATGNFRHATVMVNRINAGELASDQSELDITGYLSPGAANFIEVRASPPPLTVWAWASPLVYLKRARLLHGSLEVTIVNTTENTAQVEVLDQQFTVSPGTSATKEFPPPKGGEVQMRATSDGLDRQFEDSIEIEK